MAKLNSFSGKVHIGIYMYKKIANCFLQFAINFILEFIDHWHVQVMGIKLLTSFRIVAGKWT